MKDKITELLSVKNYKELKALVKEKKIFIVSEVENDEKISKFLTKEEYDSYIEHSRRASLMNSQQYALKILLNSIYGYTGTSFSRFFNRDLAQSVTLSGQTITKKSTDDINDYIQNVLTNPKFVQEITAMGLTITDNSKLCNDICVYNDTDSDFLCFSPVLDRIKVLDTKEKILKVVRLLANMSTIRMNEYGKVISETIFNSQNNRIEWKNELIMDKAIFVKRKKYCAHVVEKDGFMDDEVHIKGLDAVRSSIPRVFRDKLKKTIHLLLTDAPQSELDSFIRNVYEEFLTWDLKDISLPKSCNGLKKYACEGLNYNSGTPGHIRGAIAYNHFLKEFGLKDYETIKEKDKFKMVHLLNNHLSVPVIGYSNKLPKEFGITDSLINKKKHFQLCYTQPMSSILEAIGWELPNIFHQEEDIMQFFK